MAWWLVLVLMLVLVLVLVLMLVLVHGGWAQDADQPVDPRTDVFHMKYRFYFEEHDSSARLAWQCLLNPSETTRFFFSLLF